MSGLSSCTILEEDVAEGSYGVVSKGICGKRQVAIKSFFDTDPWRKELANLKKVKSIYVTELLLVDEKIIGTEWFGDDNLESLIPTRQSFLVIGSLLSQLVRGLQDIHSAKLVHCDLTARNIRYTHSGHVKIIDLGLSRKPGTIFTNRLAGDLESFFQEPLDYSFDVWGVGYLLLDLLGFHGISNTVYDSLTEDEELPKLIEEQLFYAQRDNTLDNELGTYTLGRILVPRKDRVKLPELTSFLDSVK